MHCVVSAVLDSKFTYSYWHNIMTGGCLDNYYSRVLDTIWFPYSLVVMVFG